MAFFEDIGKKVSQTGQEAIKKTKLLAETAKINTQIAAEKRTVAGLFTQIGERYYELYGVSPDEKLTELVSAVNEAKIRIRDLEDRLKALRGPESCESCGAPLSTGALFCAACGAKVPQTQEEPEGDGQSSRVCAGCIRQLPEGAQFCPFCGQKTG